MLDVDAAQLVENQPRPTPSTQPAVLNDLQVHIDVVAVACALLSVLATPTDPLMDDAGLADARRTEHSQHSIAGIGDGVEQRVALFVGLEARQISAATDLVAPLSPGLEPLWLVKSKRAALLLGELRLMRADKVGESVGVDELELL